MVWIGSGTQLPNFDAKSKSAKIQNPLYGGGKGTGPNFQLLLLSPNLLKSKILITVGWGVGESSGSYFSPNFSNMSPRLNFYYFGGGEGRGRGATLG